MTSIFEGQPRKTKPFQNKTMVIWVPGIYISLGAGFNYFLFSPLLEEMIQFDYYFFNWVVQQTM